MRIFSFHLPQFSKQQLLLLTIAIICLIGYVFLQRKPNRIDFSKYDEKHIKYYSKETAVERISGAGLTLGENNFFLDGKPFRILSGAIHYFRVVPEYWKDRLLKLKAMGLNTVETWVKFSFTFDSIKVKYELLHLYAGCCSRKFCYNLLIVHSCLFKSLNFIVKQTFVRFCSNNVVL